MSRRLDTSDEQRSQVLRHLEGRVTAIVDALNGMSVNGVLYSGLVLLDATGQWSQTFRVPFGAVSINSLAASAVVIHNQPPQQTAPASGRGVHEVAAGANGVFNVAGETLTLYGPAGGFVNVEVYAGPQPPNAGGSGGSVSAGVASFNTRTGAVTLASGDISGAGGLLAANNLSDVANAVSALFNLGGLPILESVNTVATSGAAQTIPDPVSTGKTLSFITLTAACTLTFPTAAAGKSFVVAFLENGIGGWGVTLPGTVIGAPPINTAANAWNVIGFICLDGTHWIASGTSLNQWYDTKTVPILNPTAITYPLNRVRLLAAASQTIAIAQIDGILTGTTPAATLAVQHNGTNITGLSSVALSAANANATPTGGPLALADGDTWNIVLSGLSGTITEASISITFLFTAIA